jgi:hypothetical protein
LKFDNILFWCEFPNEIDWNLISKNLGKNKVRTYVASSSVKEFEKFKKESPKNIIVEGAWPILPKEKGYWFSSWTDKKDIDFLKEFKDYKIKVDIEPPIPERFSYFWLIKYLLKKSQRKIILPENAIESTFPFPNWMLRRIGWQNNKIKNFMYYSSFVPRWLKPVYRLYYKSFIKKHNSKDTYFAMGLLDEGIFKNEPTYKNKEEFKRDLEFLNKNKVKNIVIFRLGSLQDKANWILPLLK